MSAFITESWLRERFGLAHGSEIHLPENGRLTPSARTLLEERQIRVKYLDEAGRAFVEAGPGSAKNGHGEEAALLQRVPVLTGKTERSAAICLLCSQPLSVKPDTLTSLDGKALVAKNDPRLKLRGKLDTAIAHAVWIQTEFDADGGKATLALWLADVRSALGRVLRAEVSGEAMPPVAMGDFDEAAIHAISHHPLKYLGHDHLVPEAVHGVQVARLNLLRAQIREAELLAADVFIDRDFQVTRPDIMQALNRLSSAVYILMLMTLLAERGQTISPVPPETRS